MELRADLAVVVVHAVFWTSLLFIPGVSVYWRWWQHPYGRAAVSIDGLLALALLPGELMLLFGISPGSAGLAWFTIVVLGLIPVRTVWLAWMIWRLQRAQDPGTGIPS